MAWISRISFKGLPVLPQTTREELAVVREELQHARTRHYLLPEAA